MASRLVDPVVSMEFNQITQSGRTLPEGADEFLEFLKTYFVGWAARADTALVTGMDRSPRRG